METLLEHKNVCLHCQDHPQVLCPKGLIIQRQEREERSQRASKLAGQLAEAFRRRGQYTVAPFRSKP